MPQRPQECPPGQDEGDFCHSSPLGDKRPPEEIDGTDGRLVGRTVLVMGGAGGIGAASARRLAAYRITSNCICLGAVDTPIMVMSSLIEYAIVSLPCLKPVSVEACRMTSSTHL